jgi:hypothetical protein
MASTTPAISLNKAITAGGFETIHENWRLKQSHTEADDKFETNLPAWRGCRHTRTLGSPAGLNWWSRVVTSAHLPRCRGDRL